MTTKTVTKKMVVNALKKDIALLEHQLKLTQDYIKAGCGQFLNVGNDEWCGGAKEVLRLHRNVLSFAKNALARLVKLKQCDDYAYDFVFDIWEIRNKASESWVFISGDKTGFYHNILPNLNRLACQA
jgi:hypothetical protein